MGYWQSIADKIFLIVALYIAIIIFSTSIEWRKNKLPYFILCVACLIGLCFAVEETRTITENIPAASIIVKNVTEILFVIAVSASMLLIKKYNKANFLFVCVASYATFYLADNLNDFIFSVTFGPNGFVHDEIEKSAEYVIRYIGLAVLYVLTYGVCWLVFIRKHDNSVYYVANKSVLAVFILIFCVNLFIGEMSDISTLTFLFINKLLSCILVLFVLYNQSRYLNSHEENVKLEAMIEQQKAQYERTKQIIEQVNVKAHDLKHFVEIFQSKSDMPHEVVSELKNVGNAYENIYNTGSKALDITLTEKCSHLTGYNVEFSVLADGTLVSFMSDVDIYVLFGNLLENASEAVLKESPDNRVIGLYLKKTGNFISLHIENTCTAKPQFSDGMPLTSKDDKQNHGLGTKSIKLIVTKYNGNLRMSCDGKLFTVDIVFFA